MRSSLTRRAAVVVVSVIGLSAVAPLAASAWTIEEYRHAVEIDRSGPAQPDPTELIGGLRRHVDPSWFTNAS